VGRLAELHIPSGIVALEHSVEFVRVPPAFKHYYVPRSSAASLAYRKMQAGSCRENQEFALRWEVLIAQLGLDEHRHLQCEGFSHCLCTIPLRKRAAAPQGRLEVGSDGDIGALRLGWQRVMRTEARPSVRDKRILFPERAVVSLLRQPLPAQAEREDLVGAGHRGVSEACRTAVSGIPVDAAVCNRGAQGVTTSLRGGPALRCSQVWLMSSSRVCSRSKANLPRSRDASGARRRSGAPRRTRLARP
jgi:hypothetical protein